jgi:hypothetical protein
VEGGPAAAGKIRRIYQIGPCEMGDAAGREQAMTSSPKRASITVPVMPPEVSAAFEACPPAIGARLLTVRRLIFETAAATDRVGPLTEMLRWGEPAYLTAATGSGSTIRLGWPRATPDRGAVYFHCRTTLVATFRTLFSDELAFEGNRAILLDASDPLPEGPLAACLAIAMTYHLAR